uniref:Uncharacterized protein n=1 Tax=Clastoptera arizonana TaxID=38151 RepID=A0A1B6E205_9HEMI
MLTQCLLFALLILIANTSAYGRNESMSILCSQIYGFGNDTLRAAEKLLNLARNPEKYKKKEYKKRKTNLYFERDRIETIMKVWIMDKWDPNHEKYVAMKEAAQALKEVGDIKTDAPDMREAKMKKVFEKVKTMMDVLRVW